VVRVWIILNVNEIGWRLIENLQRRENGERLGSRVLRKKIWKCPDGMHRLAARGLSLGANADALIVHG